jgi:hypothetical protein
MALYFVRADIEAVLPAADLAEALKDPGTGLETAGLFLALQARACAAVDARLSPRFTVPLAAPVPPVVSQAAVAFFLEDLWLRKGTGGDACPWFRPAQAARDALDSIGAGTRLFSSDLAISGFVPASLAVFS